MKHVFSLLIFLLFAWLGMSWYYSCDWCTTSSSTIVDIDKQKEEEALAKKAYEDSITASKLTFGLFAKDNLDQDVFRYPDNLKINNTNSDVYIPEGIADFPNKISDYLNTHQDQEIIILGYEKAAESTDSLGFKRSAFIKNLLVKAGINADRIVTQPTVEDYEYKEDGTYHGGIALNFHVLDKSRLEEVEKGIANKTLYSNFAEKTFKPDATLSNYTLELKNYLTKYPDKKVTIVGHTDDVGEAESNLWFGQERANNVKKHLISQGIDAAKLTALSKGESAPIVPNTTEENKAKNRRIEITVN